MNVWEERWKSLKAWVKEQEDEMNTSPYRTEIYYSGISCQTQYIKAKMNELDGTPDD